MINCPNLTRHSFPSSQSQLIDSAIFVFIWIAASETPTHGEHNS